jgi:predicted metal-dependent phosphoesterase TrpH
MTFPVASRSDIVWGKAELHLHTTFSDGLMTPAETIAIIAERGSVNVVAITDHDTAEGAFVAREFARQHHPQLDVIIGQEVSTGEGDVVGLFLKSTLPTFDTAAEAIDAIHQQNGLAIAVHPFVFFLGMSSVGNAIRYLPFDGVEVRHGCPLSIPSNIWASVVNYFGPRLPALGSSDSHIPFTVGQAFTWFPGVNSADLRRAIETGQVRPGGTTWKILAMLRKLPVLHERSWSKQPAKAELQL